MNFIIRNALLISVVLIHFSCADKRKEDIALFSITDDISNDVRFDKHPGRIISLAPNITETLFAIHADSDVVGVTSLCDYPPEARLKQKTGSYLSPDYESMAALKPDLIILNVETSSNPIYQALKNMGMKLFVSKAKTYDGILKMIKDFGIITGKKNNSDSLISKLQSGKQKLLNSSHGPGDSALILISINPLMTTNGTSFINDILKFANVANIYADQKIEYPEVSYEDVISKNPKKIIFPSDTNNAERSDKLIAEIKRQLRHTDAVKDNGIILVDENTMYRPGPRVLEAAINLRKKFNYDTSKGK